MTVRPGLYDQILTETLRRAVEASGLSLRKIPLDPAESHEYLARHLADVLRKALRLVPEEQRPSVQVSVTNAIIALLRRHLDEASLLEESVDDEGVVLEEVAHGTEPRRVRPLLPLSSPALLVNGHGEPRVGEELRREIASADRIDLICAFIKWFGVRVLEEPIERFLATGRPLRVITTTYLGATEQRPLEWLIERGAKVKVSYDTDITRLHAKAWLFQRDTGYSTAYVGSSNLSRSALLDGVEWNVRLSAKTTPAVIDKFSAAFETYWNDPSFEDYDPERLLVALRVERGENDRIDFALLDVHPYPHQRAILDASWSRACGHSVPS
jgi:HKD family nuclease